MWKRAFTLLLTINLMIILIPLVWILSFPRSDSIQTTSTFSSSQAARVYVDVGDQAVNAYLKSAIAEKPDVQRILSFAKVRFADSWNCDVGIKLDKRVLPFNITFIPSVSHGNLDLQIVDSTMDNSAMTGTLTSVIEIIPLPNWITFNSGTNTLQINLSELPEHESKIQAVDYSKQDHLLTLLVSIVPNLN